MIEYINKNISESTWDNCLD